MALSWTMDKLGPMARTAHDCGLVLAAIAGRDPADPSSLERGFRYPVSGGPRRRWRIAVPQGATDGIQAEAAANFAAALDRRRATATRATVASPLDKAFRDAYPDVKGGVSLIGSSNVVGVPGISVPNGFGLNGLPTGLSFVTRAFDERKLVRLARLYQSRTDWHAQPPPVP